MDVEECLKKNKLKKTKGRICILNILSQSENALSAEQIYDYCRKEGIEIDLSTIYRTVELLEEKNILEKVDLGCGSYNYILKREEHKHILKCTICKKEVEFDCPMLQIEEVIKNKTGFTPLEHELKIEGICEECREKKQK